jgi:hypothetical protein
MEGFDMSVKEMLHQEIEKLPDSLAPDIMNYIMFLENKSEKIELISQVRTLSEVSFSKIWDNEEDSIYDTL